MTKVALPELGEGINKATVSFWHITEGQAVEKGQDLVEMVTDKATFNVPSPCKGTLTQIVAKEGEDVPVGEALGIIEENS